MREVLEDVLRWRRDGHAVALATVVSVAGSAPRQVGATLAVSAAGQLSGSVSGGCVEPAVVEAALATLRDGRPHLLHYGITEAQNVERIGLSCGGEIRVFVQRLDATPATEALLAALQADREAAVVTVLRGPAPLLGAACYVEPGGAVIGALGDAALDEQARVEALAALARGAPGTFTAQVAGSECEAFVAVNAPPPRLVIIGAGQIAIALTRLAKVLGYHVTVVDARAAFATRERLPEADDVLVEWPDEALARLPLTASTAVAVLTHDEKFDVPALATALRSPVGYVGAIGSRGTRASRDERLREQGLSTEEIGRIYGPIGLDLGARTPEEIALAILAQIIQQRRRGR